MDERRKDAERLAVVEVKVDAIEKKQCLIARDVKMILATVSEAKGGWKMLMLVGGSGGVAGAFLSKWLSTFFMALPK